MTHDRLAAQDISVLRVSPIILQFILCIVEHYLSIFCLLSLILLNFLLGEQFENSSRVKIVSLWSYSAK